MSRWARTLTGTLALVGAGALVLKGVRLGMEAFGPARTFRLYGLDAIPPESEEFASRLACFVDALLYRDTRIAVLKNGDEFYPAELEAIDGARECIHLEAYEFQEGDLTREFLRRLAARARDGVDVKLTIDAIGSWRTRRSYFDPLTEAGGRVMRYHPLDWKDWPYFDHRTHRKLLIVDGRAGFAGGAGFADHWMRETNGKPRWRDTVFRVEGGAARSLDATFAQNWVSGTGEMLFSAGKGADSPAENRTACMVVMSTPGYGTSRARVLFQSLIEAARSEIRITSPYFLPDRGARQALIRAVRERGVRVQVLTAGPLSDHNSVRHLSETISARLIRAGIEYYEYQPSMIHAKLMTVDGMWTVAGSTNFDHRSFALNDEVNLVAGDPEVTGTIRRQFEEDLAESRPMSLKSVRAESLGAEVMDDANWVLRREE